MITQNQTLNLLKLLAGSFPTLKIDDDILFSWHFALEDEEPQQISVAAKTLIKSNQSHGFMPTPGMLCSLARTLFSNQNAAETAWTAGPKGANTPFLQEVWRLFGGQSRWGSLPDVKNSDDPVEAAQVMSFARKEFIELYRALEAQKQGDQAKQALTHDESVKFLDEIAKRKRDDDDTET